MNYGKREGKMAHVVVERKTVRPKMSRHQHLNAVLVTMYNFCPECGKYLSEPEVEVDEFCCSDCGEPLFSKYHKFCPWCGSAF